MTRSCGNRFWGNTAMGLLVASSLALGGCSNLQSDAASTDFGGSGNEVGSIHLALTSGTDVQISSATYALTGPAMYSRTGTVSSTGGVLSGLIGGIPAGTGYSVTLDGSATDGSVTCMGSAAFDIEAHATTSVVVPLVCREAINAGSASVTDTTNICPVVDGVAATPTAAASGGVVALTGTAHDKDNGPSPVAYQWTATAGTFDNAGTQNPNFTCPKTTTSTAVTVTVTVTDGVCTDSMDLTVTCG
jgi:hypothetical protein